MILSENIPLRDFLNGLMIIGNWILSGVLLIERDGSTAIKSGRIRENLEEWDLLPEEESG
jgi:hypothetical protein